MLLTEDTYPFVQTTRHHFIGTDHVLLNSQVLKYFYFALRIVILIYVDILLFVVIVWV